MGPASAVASVSRGSGRGRPARRGWRHGPRERRRPRSRWSGRGRPARRGWRHGPRERRRPRSRGSGRARPARRGWRHGPGERRRRRSRGSGRAHDRAQGSHSSEGGDRQPSVQPHRPKPLRYRAHQEPAHQAQPRAVARSFQVVDEALHLRAVAPSNPRGYSARTARRNLLLMCLPSRSDPDRTRRSEQTLIGAHAGACVPLR